MEDTELWNRWVLIALWIARLIPLIRSCTLLLAKISHDPSGFLRSPWHMIFYHSCFWFCLALEITEIKNFTSSRLRPLFYLFSQVFKCVLFSLNVFVETLEWTRFYTSREWEFIFAMYKDFPFYIGLAYALYICYRAHQRKRLFGTRHGLFGKDAASKLSNSIFAPGKLNSATHLVAETNIVVQIVLWINTDPKWLEKLPSSWMAGLKPLLFAARCIFCYVPLVILLPFHSRLPGEPHHKGLVSVASSLGDWDYSRPFLDQKEPGRAVPDSQPEFDLEAAREAVRLHHIPNEPRHLQWAATIQVNHRPTSSPRLLGPRYICFLDRSNTDKGTSYTVRKVEDWLSQNNTEASPDYVFISYTRKQFFTQTTFDQNSPQHKLATLKEAAARDKMTLTNYAVAAAKHAGVPAFWIDFECVKPEDYADDVADMEDVYRICDIVRAAHSLSVVLGPPLGASSPNAKQVSHRAQWFNEWGQRMWTVPEALLCPSEHRIAVYHVGSTEPELIAKRNLAGRVWDDAGALRQLIDHYEASLHLTQLELISIALECLRRRQTDTRNAGDVAYVLMGLLRLRPKVNKTDSDFQAFARLSLANDSDKFLERILCLHSVERSAAWHDMHDTWDAKLWHIDPLYQIADVCDDSDAVIIGDALGTAINWTSLELVDFQYTGNSHRARFYLSRSAASLALSLFLVFLWFVFGILPAFVSISDEYDIGFLGIEVLLRALGGPWLGAMLTSTQTPTLLAQNFDREFAATQARLFGIQGRPDLLEVEKIIFGSSRGRICWNMNGGPNEYGEDDQRHEFTLIDTSTCTATLFRARRPPTIAFVGGREGGLLRTLLCSYDEVAGAFIKETVVRLSSTISQRLHRLDRFRFAVAAEPCYKDVVPPGISVDDDDDDDDDAIEIPDIPEFRSLDDE